ncbi:MAG: UDP-3-O-[3-hydroxymyristoyl] N-acetylglucosamine deacetylase [Planctomycetes bacterium]|nr:UDP-3-O-[3-hydroxymyristoyl] N-acetylglucosamine deacetylase [Planctomycetota bacterium]
MRRPERTIKSAVEFTGRGLHSGVEVKVRLKPAPAGHGVVFTRTDLPDEPSIPATIEYLSPASRRTSLRNGKAEVETIEHLLAACLGLGVDNLEIELDGTEIPASDGSALPLAQLLESAGIVEQKATRKVYVLDEPIYVREGDASLVALPCEDPAEGLTIQYHAEFGRPSMNGQSGAAHGSAGMPLSITQAFPRSQTYRYPLDRQTFREVIAPARTFCMAEEVEKLQAAGLGKGATLENTVVIGREGQEWRFVDEPVRHKILDFLGDLSLLGADLVGHVIANKTGHAANAKLVKQLRDRIEAQEMRGDLPRESGLNIQEIMRLLPHRYPFLLIDRVVELEGYRRAVGIKNVTFNEPFFQGHWPESPIMPGVLQLEAMAQLSGVLLLRKLENTGKLAVLWSIDKVKLRGTVIPGDQLRIEVETIKVKPSLGQVTGRCKVGGRLVSEATLMFTLVDA